MSLQRQPVLNKMVPKFTHSVWCSLGMFLYSFAVCQISNIHIEQFAMVIFDWERSDMYVVYADISVNVVICFDISLQEVQAPLLS